MKPAARTAWRRLDVRLFASYVLVAAVIIAAVSLTLTVVAPSRFDDEYRLVAEDEEDEDEGHSLFVDVLRSSLPFAIAAGVMSAGVVSVIVARRIVHPVRQVRDATRRLASGHYDERVAEPGELELAELARDVNRLAVELETTERRRARLISDVAHEMRTPLTMVDGYVEGILDGVFPPDEEVLTAIVEETARLQRLAGDLAELSRSEEGAISLDRRPADLSDLAASCADRLRPQYEDKGVELELQSGPALPVDVDPDRIAQVLTNLLGNALTYTEPGGRVVVTPRQDNGSASIQITDTGIGLSPDDLDLVFERFYRVPGAARPPGGSGIGLTIARGITRAHHGTLDASSPGTGHGSTFTLRLPIRGETGNGSD